MLYLATLQSRLAENAWNVVASDDLTEVYSHIQDTDNVDESILLSIGGVATSTLSPQDCVDYVKHRMPQNSTIETLTSFIQSEFLDWIRSFGNYSVIAIDFPNTVREKRRWVCIETIDNRINVYLSSVVSTAPQFIGIECYDPHTADSIFQGLLLDLQELISSTTPQSFVCDYIDNPMNVYSVISHKLHGMEWKKIVDIHSKGVTDIPVTVSVEPTNGDTTNQYMTVREVIKLLRISDQTLASWRRNGIINYKRITDKKFLYATSDIMHILQHGVGPSETNTTTSPVRVPPVTEPVRVECKPNYIVQPQGDISAILEEIRTWLYPLTFTVASNNLKKHHHFFNFGNIGLQTGPQVMINNRGQLIDCLRVKVLFEHPQDTLSYLKQLTKQGKQPRVDTSQYVLTGFDSFYLATIQATPL